MSHFKQILAAERPSGAAMRSPLFSVPSDVSLHETGLARLEVGRFFLGEIGVGQVISSGHDTLVSEPTGATLIVPLSGRITSAACGGPEHTAAKGEALFFAPNRRVTRVQPMESTSFVGVPIIVPRRVLLQAGQHLDLNARNRRGLDSFALAMAANSAAAQEVIALAHRIHHVVATGDPRILEAEAQRSWSWLLAERMIALLDAVGAVGLRPAPDGRAAVRHVRRARDLMEAQCAEIVTLADTAVELGISVRTLEASFQEVWGQTPYQALTDIRLGRARRLLLEADPDTSVTRIALQCGFSHLGRFSGTYLKRFGESPSATLRRGRR